MSLSPLLPSTLHRPPAPAPKLGNRRLQGQAARKRVLAHGVVPLNERNGWWLKHPQPNLLDCDGLSQLVGALEQNTDRLVLVEFFAPWCASCKALYPKLSKICGEHPEIVLVKVNFEENKTLARKLGVQVLPFFHAYHGSMGRVAAFSGSLTKIQRIYDCLELFGKPYCDIEGHNGTVDVTRSLPEFEKLPVPDDATRLKFTAGGHFDEAATFAAKQAQQVQQAPAM